ncbi:MAG: hypothetical protein FVQ81_14275 [Candidatus Glassbacteria bacterium]|nr:hypothetical protein [Candidatus Glassbacteria bacterium]
MIRKTVPACLILLASFITGVSAADFSAMRPVPLSLLRNHPHGSLPNPDAPALKSFMDGNPAGTMLAAEAWPVHYRIGVVRIEFQPDENPATTGNGTWGDIPFFTFSDSTSGLVVEDPTVDSRSKLYIQRNLLHVSQYYEKVSGGKVIFEVPDSADISRIYQLDVELKEYGNDDDYSLRTSRFATDAIAAADNELDFSQYDVVMVFHAGCGQHTDFDEKSPDDLHPVSINHILLREILADGDPSYQGIETNDTDPDGGTHHVQFIQIFPETAVQDWEEEGNPQGALQGLLGVMVHELGHFFGLPDLYDTFTGSRPTIGFYALMATGFFNTVSRIPSYPMAWTRVFLGWDEPLVVKTDLSDVVLRAAELADDPGVPKVIKVPISSTEYYLLELRLRDENFNNRFDYNETGGNVFPDIMEDDYRLPDGSLAEFDWSIPYWLNLNLPPMSPADSARLGSGVLIWHIDEQVIREQFTRDLTLNYLNTDPQHLGIRLEEADGLDHMLQPFPASFNPGFGSPFDVFGGAVPGTKSAELGNLNVNFGPFTSPNSTSYTGVASNIAISGFNSLTVQPGAPVVDSLVSVEIDFNALGDGGQIVHPLPGWPVRMNATSAYSTPVVAEIDPSRPGLETVQANDSRQAVLIYSDGQTLIIPTDDPPAGSPAAGDITGDGQADVVIADANGRVSAFTTRTVLESVDGYPIDLQGQVQYSPVLADVDGDGTRDVIVVTTAGGSSRLHVLDENGSEMSGYPVEFFASVTARPSVLEDAGGAVEAIYVLTAEGNLISLAPSGSASWTVTLGDSSVCAPVVGLMGLPGNGEAYRVNVFGITGDIFSFLTDGTPADGWPVRTDGLCLAGGALGDVDGDGLNELVVPVDYPDEEYSSRNRIYVLDYNGSSAPGMPIEIGSPRQLDQQRYLSQPTLADVDGDGIAEILVATAERLVLAYRGDGGRRPVARYITGGYGLMPPVAADIDRDGLLELICADGEGYVYAYATRGNALAGGWSGLGGNSAHTGFTSLAQQKPGTGSGAEILPDKFCYLYPNPVRGSRANLTYRLGGSDVQRVTVEIFTTSGERVANFEGSVDAAVGIGNQVTWDVDRYASGVYLVLVKAHLSTGGTVQTMRKMAVIK